VYSEAEKRLVSLDVKGAPVADDAQYGLILQSYHAKNALAYLTLDTADLTAFGAPRVAATSAQTVLKEWLASHQNETRKAGDRLVYLA
jgi:hypothetical protein